MTPDLSIVIPTYNRPGDLERIYRDLSFYVRHDNDDHILATIGRALLGQDHDRSFYVP